MWLSSTQHVIENVSDEFERISKKTLFKNCLFKPLAVFLFLSYRKR
jgi:hypothetical protein